MELICTAVLLGIAGFDPTGAVVIISALAMNAKKKDILTFALTTFIGTVAVGIICSYFVGNGIKYLADMLNYIPDSIWLLLEFIVVCFLFKWFVDRAFLNKKKEKHNDNFIIKYIKKGLFAVGVIFAVTALTDPSFIALITLAGHDMHFVVVLVANCMWILISQSPIFILTVAVMFGKHDRIISFVNEKIKESNWFIRVKLILPKLLTVVILMAGLLLLTDGICYLITDKWLF